MMSDEKEFVNGLMVKRPHDNAPDFVKCAISIKRSDLINWLSDRTDDWINIQVKESRAGKYYAEVDKWKPKGEQQSAPQQSSQDFQQPVDDGFDDEIPF